MLDRSQPHDEVYGLPGIKWSQGGRLYDLAGHPVTFRREETGEIDASDEKVERVVIEKIIDPPKKVFADVVSSHEPEGPTDLRSLHWKQLQAMVVQYGGPPGWTNMEDAIAFLRGKMP
jgi:hypothetical protein